MILQKENHYCQKLINDYENTFQCHIFFFFYTKIIIFEIILHNMMVEMREL